MSGIQPTGDMHLGNYLGAIKNWVALQDTDNECFYCVVDYHAITVSHDPKLLRQRTLNMARDLMACGVHPERSTLFIQSQVPEHQELAWILASVTSYGDLGRMTQFKDKALRGGSVKETLKQLIDDPSEIPDAVIKAIQSVIPPGGEPEEPQDDQDKPAFVSAGLFTYPILQAADILAYQATGVPVGDDQIQHLELARGIARRFNKRFGLMFPETQAILTKGARIMSPTDPTKKMSKSLGEQHYMGLFEDEGSIRKKIKRHVTATGGEAHDESQTPPGVANLLTILENVAPPEVFQGFKEQEEAGELRYSELKPAVADHVMEMLTPFRERRESISDDDVRDVVRAGAKVAKESASAVVAEARERLGIIEI